MQKGFLRVLIVLGAVRGLVACSVPEAAAAAASSTGTAPRDHQLERKQRALDRQRLQPETRILSDLRKLHDGGEGSTEAAGSAPYKLLMFGGASHEVYLGCLCEEQNAESVFNLAGEFGSDLSANSVRNKFAPYGSNREDTSACNVAATHPPSVVASDGKSLGLLTLNASLEKRIAAPSVGDWLARMCKL